MLILLMLLGSAQMELEHRTPKARYKRTDKKLFIKQLARIERREARLRRIRARLSQEGRIGETVAKTPHEHHHIGASQNQFEHIGTFLRRNSEDPAVKVQRYTIRKYPVISLIIVDFHRTFSPSSSNTFCPESYHCWTPTPQV